MPPSNESAQITNREWETLNRVLEGLEKEIRELRENAIRAQAIKSGLDAKWSVATSAGVTVLVQCVVMVLHHFFK